MSGRKEKQKWRGVSVLRYAWEEFCRGINERAKRNPPNLLYIPRERRDNTMLDEFDRWRRFLAENKEIRGTAIVIFDDQDKFLILKRAPRSVWMPNHWGLPGGRIDPGEVPPETIVRETKEEVNLDVSDVKELETKSEHGVYFTTRTYSGELQLSDEHTDFAWVSLDELSNYKTTPNLESRVKEALNDY